MRFAAVSVVTAILATSAAASPTARRNDMAVAQVQSRDLASDVGAIVSGAGSGVSADDLEHDLESLLGDLVVKVRTLSPLIHGQDQKLSTNSCANRLKPLSRPD